jgi:hypothetical protein
MGSWARLVRRTSDGYDVCRVLGRISPVMFTYRRDLISKHRHVQRVGIQALLGRSNITDPLLSRVKSLDQVKRSEQSQVIHRMGGLFSRPSIVL